MAAATLWECFTQWSVPLSMYGPSTRPQAILAHAAAEISATDPGEVNRYNAYLIGLLYETLQVPVIVQGELAIACQERDIPLAAVSLRQAEAAPKYLSSRDIALWQKAECDKIGATRVVLVSYYPHYWRALKCTEKVGLTVLVPNGLKEMYDPKGSQWWAKYGFINRPYELAARLDFYRKGWI